MTQPTEEAMKEAREILGSCVCHIVEYGKYYCDLHKYLDKFTAALTLAEQKGRDRQNEDCIEALEKLYNHDKRECIGCTIDDAIKALRNLRRK